VLRGFHKAFPRSYDPKSRTMFQNRTMFFTVAIQWSNSCTTSTTLHDRRTTSRAKKPNFIRSRRAMCTTHANYRTMKRTTLRQLVQLLQRCAICCTRLARDSHERCTIFYILCHECMILSKNIRLSIQGLTHHLPLCLSYNISVF